MDSSLRSRLLYQLSFLEGHSQKFVLDHLEMLAARHYAQGSLESIVGVIKRFTNNLPAERRLIITENLTQTTTADLDYVLNSLQIKEYAPVTINHGFSLLGEFFDFLIENNQMLRQPVNKRRHRVFAPTTLPKPMPEANLVQFFKVIDSIRDRVIFLLMLRCGLRVSEACSLSWKDIDWEEGTIRINNGKGLVDRVAYLAFDLEQSLKLWHARNLEAEFLFPSRLKYSTHIKRKVIYAMMVKYLKIAEIKQSYSPHCLRHSFATQLLNAGVSIEVLKELMGHRSIQMTLRYAELYETTKRNQYNEAMKRIEKRQVI